MSLHLLGIRPEVLAELGALNPDVVARFDAVMQQRQFYGCSRDICLVPRTPEEAAAAQEAERRYAIRQVEAKGAEDRALALLTARLGSRDATLFAKTGTLMRPSRLWPGVEYLIPTGSHEMVRVVRDGREQTRLCVVAGQGEPWPDRTMTILDLLESGQERRLWEMANVFPGTGASTNIRPGPEAPADLDRMLKEITAPFDLWFLISLLFGVVGLIALWFRP